MLESVKQSFGDEGVSYYAHSEKEQAPLSGRFRDAVRRHIVRKAIKYTHGLLDGKGQRFAHFLSVSDVQHATKATHAQQRLLDSVVQIGRS